MDQHEKTNGSNGKPVRLTWLEEHRDRLDEEARKTRNAETGWSLGRLALFVLAIAVWIPLDAHRPLAVAASAGLLVCFAFAVRRHSRVRDRCEFLARSLTVTEEALSRCGGQVMVVRGTQPPQAISADAAGLPAVADDGPLWSLTDQESDDLDLFEEPVGIFGLLNRCSTGYGARRLGEMVRHSCLSAAHIRARQTAVQHLEEHAEGRVRLMAACAVLRRQDEWLERFADAVAKAHPLPWPVRSRVLRVWSIISALAVALFTVLLATGPVGWVYGIIGLGAFNGLLFWWIREPLDEALKPWRSVGNAARGLSIATRQAVEELPRNGLLGSLQTDLEKSARPEVLPSLVGRVAWADGGGMVQTLFNVFFFYELHVSEAILARAVPHRETIRRGISALAEVEALASIACFAYEQPVRSYPRLVDETSLQIRGGLHPLIGPDRVVPNDVVLDQETRMWVITGSNMSGKSTLLRMSGVCVVLAQMGSAVPAEDMAWSPVRLVSDLQVRDNLSADESYFLAEVRHLRRMLTRPADGSAVLGLMDEPFRGTNSDEQVAASLAVVEHLIQTPDLFLVATHEQRVTSLATGTPAANRHFQEDLSDGAMVFDYRLREGPATTRNALLVLEREGYPAEVLRRAREQLASVEAT